MKHKTQRTTVEKRKEALKKYNNTPERKAKVAEYYQKNKLKAKDRSLRNLYGITLDDYDQMLVEQNDCCYICNAHKDDSKKGLSVDHDHETGKVRKLLCGPCNTALGLVKEDVNIMKKLIEYVETN
jgi:hypothetical protein